MNSLHSRRNAKQVNRPSTPLDEFLQAVERRAFKLAVISTRDRNDALDIVQEAMYKLVKNYRDKASDEWPMLFQRILQHCILDWHRVQSRQRRLFWWKRCDADAIDDTESIDALWDSSLDYPSTDTPADLIACAQDIACVNAAIEALTIRQQQAFLLRNWEGYDVEQTANIMGCTKSSVKTHHSRALIALRTALEAQSETPANAH